MHHPLIYASVHKRHHCPVPEVVASVAWLDTQWEFIMGEIPALSMALNVFPTNPVFHAAWFAYQGLASAADHAAFKFTDEDDGGVIHWFHQQFLDGEFHYYHHLNPKVNFAEEEWIDYLFGTHHTYSKWWERYQRRHKRLAQERSDESEGGPPTPGVTPGATLDDSEDSEEEVTAVKMVGPPPKGS